MPANALSQNPTITTPPSVHPLKRYPEAKKIYSWDSGRNFCQLWDLSNGKLSKFLAHKCGIYESDIHFLIQRSAGHNHSRPYHLSGMG